MALIKCNKCNKEINDTDKYCFHCGGKTNYEDTFEEIKKKNSNVKQENKKKKELSVFQWLIIFFSIFIFLALILNIPTSNNTTNKIDNTTNSIEDLRKYEKVVDIVDFTETYYNNELAGNKEYSGKRIKITGKLNNTDVDDSLILNLGTTCYLDSGKHYDVACNFDGGDVGNLSNFVRGDYITIIGTVDTLRDAFPNDVIYLKKCIVVE